MILNERKEHCVYQLLDIEFCIRLKLDAFNLLSCPKLFLTSFFHLSLAPRTCSHVPDAYLITATLEAEASDFAPVGGCYIGDDASYDDVLNSPAVRAYHWGNLLPEQSSAFVNIGLIAAIVAAVFLFPCHAYSVVIAKFFAKLLIFCSDISVLHHKFGFLLT